MRLAASVFLATVLLIPQGVAAQIVDNDTVTLDSTTNFEWLDISMTTNRSFNDVMSEFGPAGWQHATAAEVADFWRHASIPDVPGNSAENFGPVSELMELVGTTRTWGGYYSSTTGMVSDPGTIAGRVLSGVLFKDAFSSQASTALSQEIGVTLAFPELGHWLVRKPTMTIDSATLTKGLMADIGALSLPKGMTNSLMAKLQAAMKNIADGDDQNNGGAVGPLSAFMNAVNAQNGKHLTNNQAGELNVAAQAIIDALTN